MRVRYAGLVWDVVSNRSDKNLYEQVLKIAICINKCPAGAIIEK